MAVRRAQWACPWAGLLGWAGAGLVEDIRVCTAFDSCYRALAVHLGRGDGTFYLPTLPPPEGDPGSISPGILARYPCVMSLDPVAYIRLAARSAGGGAGDLRGVA